MKKVLLVLFATTLAASALAEGAMTTGAGTSTSPSKDIVGTAVATPDLSTLVAAVKAGGLVETLQGTGPFTVFAPTNEAFEKLPAGTLDTLLKPESKATLDKILTYHVVAGKVMASDLVKQIKAGNGSASLKTVQGETLKAMLRGASVVIEDQKGGTAIVAMADVKTSNGVVHVIDTVLLPN
jgi:uncharacterized surface protein with fasciclin (FAS1) repeats